VVTAKLPERDGVFEYRVRSASEEHERAALENVERRCCREQAAGGAANQKAPAEDQYPRRFREPFHAQVLKPPHGGVFAKLIEPTVRLSFK
jgi:hypothetical protein